MSRGTEVRVAFRHPDSWAQFNRQIEYQMGLVQVGGSVRAYHSVELALVDVSSGLMKQFPHKKKIVFLKEASPSLRFLAEDLSREGAEVVIQEIKTETFESLPRDALMVLWSEDDPLFGKSLEVQGLMEHLVKNRIFGVRLSHFAHAGRTLHPLDRYYIEVQGVSNDLAVVVHSSRLKWSSLIGPTQNWTKQHSGESKVKENYESDPVARNAFEAQLAQLGARSVFPGEIQRLGDRAVVYWPDIDGWSLIHTLGEEAEANWATTSLSFWRGLRTMDWLRELGFTDSMIRGTVLIPQQCWTTDWIERIRLARQAILKQQGLDI